MKYYIWLVNTWKTVFISGVTRKNAVNCEKIVLDFQISTDFFFSFSTDCWQG